MSYDTWKTSAPEGVSDAELQAVADFYFVEPADVTDNMLADYEHDLRERAAGQ